ncbi:YjfB family protein [Paenibacillus sp. SI8]|uniref:YjfB family protein n=1 Tax=unclassified Paenibacillus TaxID=185978 RepID=UPI003465B182
MNVNSVLSAINGGGSLQQAVGLQLLSNSKDIQKEAAATLLQDFVNTQQQVQAAAASATPHLGKHIDIRA